MDIYEKIIKLLVASGNVSEEKVEQARKLAESLVWDGEVRPTQRVLDSASPLPDENDPRFQMLCAAIFDDDTPSQ